MEKDKNHRGFLWNTSLYLISTVFSVLINLIVLPVYTRHLSPSDYGIAVLFTMFGTLLAGILSINLHFASYIYYFQFKEDRDRFKIIYSTNALFVLFVFLISGILLNQFSGRLSLFLYKGQLSADLILLSFISGCFEYFVLYMITLLTAQVKPVQYTVIIVLRAVINTASALYFIFFQSLTYMAMIYSTILSQVVAILVLLITVRDLFGFRFSISDLKMSLKLAFPLLPNSMIGYVYSSFDKTMLGNLKNTDSVGYYSFGERFSIVLKAAQDAVSKSWEPFFMNKAYENSVQAREAIIIRFYEIAFLFMVIGLTIIYYSEEMIKLLTTKAFYPSMYVVPLYVYFYLFAVMGTLSMNQISFSKKMAYLLPTSICVVIINIISNIVLIPRYGAVGAAGAIAISALFSNLMNLYFGMKLYPLPLGKWKLAKMYMLLMAFTLPVYPIILMDIPVIVKMILKLIIMFLFVLAGVKMHYISKANIMRVFDKIKGTAMNLSGS